MNGLNPETIEKIKQKVIDLSFAFGPKLAVAVVLVIIGVLVARWLGQIFANWLNKMRLEPPVRQLLVRIMRLLVVFLFFTMALQNLGIQLLPLIAGLGVASAGVVLALQGVLRNLVAGFTIIFTKPFKVGEYVAMVGVEGRVDAIDLFSARLAHPDKSLVVVPNRKIVGEILHNYGTVRQLNLVVCVAYATDLNRALAAINQVVEANPRVLKEPAPNIGVTTLADSSINIAAQPWVNVPDYGAAGGELYKAIVEKFRAEKIEIPFPQREVRFLADASE